ncbi:Tryptophan RNA-binding attenuator protein-like [Senna tora]|uniref:Tryptophan RNA-binding attenuator protein-like n=1 Tax=Senna tora TaxID=362788 RepID=A0A834WZA7_9FABA|nr:Tryptophan RNA-binding attenuator protein-like [Senna tora]
MNEGTLEAELGAVLSELLKRQRALVSQMTKMEERTANIEAMVRQIFQDEFGQECVGSKHSNLEERFEPCEEFSLDFGGDGNLEDESRSELVMSKVATPESLLDEVQPDEAIEDHSHIETNSDAMLSDSDAILFEAYDCHDNAEMFGFGDMVSASEELLNFVGGTFGINPLIAYEVQKCKNSLHIQVSWEIDGLMRVLVHDHGGSFETCATPKAPSMCLCKCCNARSLNMFTSENAIVDGYGIYSLCQSGYAIAMTQIQICFGELEHVIGFTTSKNLKGRLQEFRDSILQNIYGDFEVPIIFWDRRNISRKLYDIIVNQFGAQALEKLEMSFEINCISSISSMMEIVAGNSYDISFCYDSNRFLFGEIDDAFINEGRSLRQWEIYEVAHNNMSSLFITYLRSSSIQHALKLVETDANLGVVRPQVNMLCMEAEQLIMELGFIYFMYGYIEIKNTYLLENEVGRWQWLFGKTISIIVLPNLKLREGYVGIVALSLAGIILIDLAMVNRESLCLSSVIPCSINDVKINNTIYQMEQIIVASVEKFFKAKAIWPSAKVHNSCSINILVPINIREVSSSHFFIDLLLAIVEHVQPFMVGGKHYQYVLLEMRKIYADSKIQSKKRGTIEIHNVKEKWTLKGGLHHYNWILLLSFMQFKEILLCSFPFDPGGLIYSYWWNGLWLILLEVFIGLIFKLNLEDKVDFAEVDIDMNRPITRVEAQHSSPLSSSDEVCVTLVGRS